MWESEIVPKRFGNKFGCVIKVDTPEKRYVLDMVLSQEEYERFQRGAGEVHVERICGVTVEEGNPETVFLKINGKRHKCKRSNPMVRANAGIPPTGGGLCAVTLTGLGVFFPQVEIEELPENTRRAYLDAKRGAGVGDAELRALAEQQEKISRDLEAGLGRIEQAAKDSNRKPGECEWWQNLWAAFDREPHNLNDGERWRKVARMVLAGVWENANKPNWANSYLGETTFRRLAKNYRILKETRAVMRDKLWTMLDKQWTGEQEKAWAKNLRRYAERERDRAKKKTAKPKKPA